MTIFEKIQDLEQVNAFSKHEQIIKGIIDSIDDKVLEKGHQLPSVNQMVSQLGFARKTIVKAYDELKDRGIIESRKRLGYFVLNDATEQIVKVALLIYAFHPFQEMFYNAFREGLGENIQVDVFFHHSNMEVFETMIGNIRGKYGMYVIAPIPNPNSKKILDTLPRHKLLLVDRYEELDGEFSHITQEFEIATYMALKELIEPIRQYDDLTLFFLPNSDYPAEVKRAFERFLQDFNIKGTVERNYIPDSVKKGKAYFTIGDSDLWKILKDCKKKGLRVGTEVGILSNNNSPVKEIVFDGITTLSTDFEVMGYQAAEFILNRTPIKRTIPTVLIRRNSL